MASFADADTQGILDVMAQQTIQGPVPGVGGSVVEVCGITNCRQFQTVVVMAIVASPRSFAAAVKREAVSTVGGRCHSVTADTWGCNGHR